MMQNLIHNLKFKMQEDVGILLGAGLMEEFESHLGFKEIECVVTVPLHHRKLKQRGFNQVTRFSQELARKLGTEFMENLLEKIEFAHPNI